jgi:hypothetical protein
MSRKTLNDAVEQLLTAHAGEWVDARQIAAVGGFAAWRTRISNLRTLRGLNIENRVRMIVDLQGRTFKVSEYRLLSKKTEAA